MKYSNFKIKRIYTDPTLPPFCRSSNLYKTIIATVDVSSGVLFKKVHNITIVNEFGGIGAWVDINTGKFTRGTAIEELFRAYQLKNKLDELEHSS